MFEQRYVIEYDNGKATNHTRYICGMDSDHDVAISKAHSYLKQMTELKHRKDYVVITAVNNVQTLGYTAYHTIYRKNL